MSLATHSQLSRWVVARIFLTLAALIACASTTATLAQDFPGKPIKIVVPFAPGGPTDALARMVGDRFKDKLKQAYIVENRPGGGQVIGAEAVAKSPADGHTLLLGGSAFYLNPLLTKTSFDPFKDLIPIARMALIPLVITTHASAPYRTFGELIAYARANPEKVTFAVSSYLGADHLGFALLEKTSEARMTMVLYKGSAAALPDLIAGRVDLQMSTGAAFAPHVQSGKLRMLATTTKARTSLIPDVPTVAELGFPLYEQAPGYSLFAPAGTPAQVIGRLESEVRALVQAPDMADRFKVLSLAPTFLDSVQLDAAIRREVQIASDVIKTAGIKRQQ